MEIVLLKDQGLTALPADNQTWLAGKLAIQFGDFPAKMFDYPIITTAIYIPPFWLISPLYPNGFPLNPIKSPLITIKLPLNSMSYN